MNEISFPPLPGCATKYMHKTYSVANTIPAFVSWTLASSGGSVIDVKLLPYLFFRDPAFWLVADQLLEDSREQSASTAHSWGRTTRQESPRGTGVVGRSNITGRCSRTSGVYQRQGSDTGTQDELKSVELIERYLVNPNPVPLYACTHAVVLTPESLDTHYAKAQILLITPHTFVPLQKTLATALTKTTLLIWASRNLSTAPMEQIVKRTRTDISMDIADGRLLDTTQFSWIATTYRNGIFSYGWRNGTVTLHLSRYAYTYEIHVYLISQFWNFTGLVIHHYWGYNCLLIDTSFWRMDLRPLNTVAYHISVLPAICLQLLCVLYIWHTKQQLNVSVDVGARGTYSA